MLLVVGRIGKAHGVRGDLFVEPMTDEPEVRFANNSKLITSTDQTLTVVQSKWHSGRFVVHFSDVDDRTKAESLKGLQLSVEVDPLELPEDPDEFYDHQLVNLQVMHNKVLIGKVSEVIHLPGQDLLVVNADSGTEILIPFVKQIVPEVDVISGQIHITPPAGLINESEAEVVSEVPNEN
jgi:16S rRNA processing protein RimM